jgi:hypothetical protein
MGFFESIRRAAPPEPPPGRRRLPEWFHPARNVMPAAVPIDRLLVQRPELAVYVSLLQVYPRGFEFDVNVLRRRTAAGRFETRHDSPFARHRPPVSSPLASGPEEESGAFLSLGVRYADGRRAVPEQAPRPPFDEAEPPRPPVISPSSGRGSPGEWRQRYWVWGLPESGDIEVVYSWPAEGVPESVLALDGEAVRAASERAVTLWNEPVGADEGDGGTA